MVSKQGRVMEGKERLQAGKHATLLERKEERKEESGVPNLLETFNLNLPWRPVLIDQLATTREWMKGVSDSGPDLLRG